MNNILKLFRRKPERYYLTLFGRSGNIYVLNRHPSSGNSWGMFGKHTLTFASYAEAHNYGPLPLYHYDHGESVHVEPVSVLPAKVKALLVQ